MIHFVPEQLPLTDWTIELYVDSRDRCPVADFLNDLPKVERAEVRNALRLLQEFGILLGAARPSHHRPP